jgi:plastocyanin
VGRRARILLLTAISALAVPSAAQAVERTLTFTTGPFRIGPHAVLQGARAVPSPKVDGYVVAITADVVDAAGDVVPDESVMLHHVVFAKVFAPDMTCTSFRGYDGQTTGFPAERFYGRGEEHMSLDLPAGYGYPNRGSDVWGLIYMLMNHHRTTAAVSIRYQVRYVTGESLAPARPVWLDIRNCLADPIYNVPGTGGRGSTHTRTFDFRLPESGRLLGGGGHLHGGGIRLDLANATCGTHLFSFQPTWGGVEPEPLMHESGPTKMSSFRTGAGIPVATGDTLRLTSVYDNSLPHVRVMGIAIVYFSPAPVSGCHPTPPLEVDLGNPGAPPRVTLPLLRQPRGAVARNLGGTWVGDYRYGHERVSLRRGARFRWRFVGRELHDVTLANGPIGFASPSLRRGSYSFRFARSGSYKLFCSLHPTRMTQIINVRG